MVGFIYHGNELSGPTKGGTFLGMISAIIILKKNFYVISYL